MARFFTNLMRKYLPDPLVFAIGLTLLTVVMAMVFKGQSLFAMTEAWGKGFWSLLAFTTQMATMLATGYVLAKAPLVDKAINAIVSSIKSPKAAVAAATIVGGVTAYLNWGFGLIVGVLFARKLAQKIDGVHYPLIIASAYSTFSLYSIGLSGTIPILIATKGHFLEKTMGVVPLSQTSFSMPILLMGVAILITVPILNVMLMPKNKEEIIELDRNLYKETAAKIASDPNEVTIAEKINNSYILNFLIGIMGLGYVAFYFASGKPTDLNIINLTMLFLGLLFMGSPIQYIAALNEGAKALTGIILQYPFYAGIMAIMGSSGLVTTFAQGFVDISTKETLPFWGLVSSFVINFFAPSAGGHWVIQGPFMMEAAKALNADAGKTAMAVMLGNGWNDLVQPFWLLPTLAISGLKLSDIMGYTVINMLWTGVIMCVGVLIWGYM